MIQLYAIAAAVAVAVGFGAGWKANGWRHDSAALAAQVNQRATERLRRQNANTQATVHEADKTKIRTEFVTITERVENEIAVEKVVYSNVCIAPGGLRELANAARATGYTGEPSNPMPAASAPK